MSDNFNRTVDRFLKLVEDTPEDTPSPERGVDVSGDTAGEPGLEAEDDYREAAATEYTASDMEDLAEGDGEEGEEVEGTTNIVSAPQPGSSSGQGGGRQVRFKSTKGGNTGSVLGQYKNWSSRDPKTAPLGYEVPSDASGGVEVWVLQGAVDFSNADDVFKANNHVRQKRERARANLGLPPTRENLQHRKPTQQMHDFLVNEYHTYGAANSNRRIPMPLLTNRFNAHFQETTPRTAQSLNMYIIRQLNDVRESYTGRQRRRR